MANKKNYWYVLVLTDEGPVFVTGFGEHHTAFWNAEKMPESMSATHAEEVSFGLRVNGTQAYAVKMPYELEFQPYRYNMGKFKWVWKEGEEE